MEISNREREVFIWRGCQLLILCSVGGIQAKYGCGAMVEWLWQGRNRISRRKTLLTATSTAVKSHMDWSGIKPEPVQQEACDQPRDIRKVELNDVIGVNVQLKYIGKWVCTSNTTIFIEVY